MSFKTGHISCVTGEQRDLLGVALKLVIIQITDRMTFCGIARSPQPVISIFVGQIDLNVVLLKINSQSYTNLEFLT